MRKHESEKNNRPDAKEKPSLWQRLVTMQRKFSAMMNRVFPPPEPQFVSHVIDDGFTFPYHLFIPEREIAALAAKLGTTVEVIKGEINRDKNTARSLEQIEKELPPSPELQYLVQFVRNSKRGFCGGVEGKQGGSPSWSS